MKAVRVHLNAQPASGESICKEVQKRWTSLKLVVWSLIKLYMIRWFQIFSWTIPLAFTIFYVFSKSKYQIFRDTLCFSYNKKLSRTKQIRIIISVMKLNPNFLCGAFTENQFSKNTKESPCATICNFQYRGNSAHSRRVISLVNQEVLWFLVETSTHVKWN